LTATVREAGVVVADCCAESQLPDEEGVTEKGMFPPLVTLTV
jgi:hypothetical protein